MEKKIENKSHLASLLQAKRMEFNEKANEVTKRIYQEGIDAIENSDILDRALKIGDKAPDFTLNDPLNKPVRLYDELKNGPVVLTWYRGGWCPYCNITLRYLQSRLPEFKQEGASLLALTPELPDKSLSTAEKHALDFQVLSDIGNAVGKEFGVVFQMTQDLAANYQASFDLQNQNGDDSAMLPLAATYIIDQDGIIRYAFLDTDYRNRAEPDEIIVHLKTIKK